MPANIMLPTKAKMAALVCSGRRRPKLSHDVFRLACQWDSWVAMITPRRRATAPQITVARENARQTSSS